ncbi:hypothetical protein DPM19_05835 [Actinomadura craniellae]|uniref:SWIM-type domain-containing protein n=1 Tax=Actinomadura craniellae TaxID=2231787 RepID=A0A365HBD7_9ACTN|nr:hypothetical protein [Actinomadura craniellae]RAY16395.1 hypothetical protein DPM19_05835 [Actinomadura craniellae]
MVTRPVVEPGLLAELIGAAPARVRRRLDADPALADGWTWTETGGGWQVAAGGETVRLAGPRLTGADQVGCSCLLAPRCLHLLAVLTVLDTLADQEEAPPAEPEETGAEPDPRTRPARTVDSAAEPDLSHPSPAGTACTGTSRTGADQTGADQTGADQTGAGQTGAGQAGTSRTGAGLAGTRGDEAVELTEAQAGAARLAVDAGARLLATGAQAAGALLRADLLRAAHAARQASLPRLAAAATRVAGGMRDLATARPAFALEVFAADLAELIATAHRLDRAPDAAAVGVARRSYAPTATARLHGLCSEAVVTASGYAGVVTYLTDGAGRLHTVSDVMPGGPERPKTAYRSAARLGRLTLDHHDLGRSGVFGQGLTATADGRLGGGEGADAARLAGTPWTEPPLAALWEAAVGDQLDRAWAAAGLPETARPAGADLLFLDTVVAGLTPEGVLLEVAGADPVHALSPAGDHRAVLRRLGTLHGEPLRLVGRIHPSRPRTLTLLAVAAPALHLPDRRLGRINVGLDDLPGAALGPAAATAAPRPAAAPEPPDDPLAGLRRTLHRATLGGRATLAGAATAGLRAESARLRRSHLPTAADLLDHLHAAAAEVERTVTGESRPAAPEPSARAWAAAMAYLDAAHRALLRAAWS